MKYVVVALIIIAVIITYVIMSAIQPAVNSIIASANASGNWTGFESTQKAIESFPLYMWAIPGLVGAVGIVITLKSGGNG